MMGARLPGKLRDREPYATGLLVPHLAGLVYLVKIAINDCGLRVERNERHEVLEAWACSNYSQFQLGKYGRVNCNEEVPLHFWRLAPGN